MRRGDTGQTIPLWTFSAESYSPQMMTLQQNFKVMTLHDHDIKTFYLV